MEEKFLSAINEEVRAKEYGKIFSKSLELRLTLEVIVKDIIRKTG